MVWIRLRWRCIGLQQRVVRVLESTGPPRHSSTLQQGHLGVEKSKLASRAVDTQLKSPQSSRLVTCLAFTPRASLLIRVDETCPHSLSPNTQKMLVTSTMILSRNSHWSNWSRTLLLSNWALCRHSHQTLLKFCLRERYAVLSC